MRLPHTTQVNDISAADCLLMHTEFCIYWNLLVHSIFTALGWDNEGWKKNCWNWRGSHSIISLSVIVLIVQYYHPLCWEVISFPIVYALKSYSCLCYVFVFNFHCVAIIMNLKEHMESVTLLKIQKSIKKQKLMYVKESYESCSENWIFKILQFHS